MKGEMMKNIIFIIVLALLLTGCGAKLSQSFESNVGGLKPLLIRQFEPRSKYLSKDNKDRIETKDYKKFSACLESGEKCKLSGIMAGQFGPRQVVSSSGVAKSGSSEISVEPRTMRQDVYECTVFTPSKKNSAGSVVKLGPENRPGFWMDHVFHMWDTYAWNNEESDEKIYIELIIKSQNLLEVMKQSIGPAIAAKGLVVGVIENMTSKRAKLSLNLCKI
jgi:hypothetical protein